MSVEIASSTLEFDYSITNQGAGISCSNNQAEYEALIAGQGTLADMRGHSVVIVGDSQLVIGQLSGA